MPVLMHMSQGKTQQSIHADLIATTDCKIHDLLEAFRDVDEAASSGRGRRRYRDGGTGVGVPVGVDVEVVVEVVVEAVVEVVVVVVVVVVEVGLERGK